MTDQSLNIQIKERPKICAIDLEEEIIEALQNKGLYCYSGTLGPQVKVPNSGRHDRHQCLLNLDFPPNLHEYDIVIVDLQKQKPIEYLESEHTQTFVKGSVQPVLLSSYPETVFDPRPLSSSILRRNLEEFFSRQTLVIVFCSAQEVTEYHFARVTRNGVCEDKLVEHRLYEFIPQLQSTYNKIGRNVTVSDFEESIKSFLQKHSKNFIYEIVFQHPRKWLQDERRYVESSEFIPLLLNSNNEIIGFVDFRLRTSAIFAFPQLKYDVKKSFLLELIDEILPGLFPEIFPYSERFSWLKSREYFLPNQANLLTKKAKLEDEYRLAVTEIESEIKKNQSKYKFLHNLLTETGNPLVKSVEYFLAWIGFENIVNMDETNPEIKEEDLQIPLEKGLLVVEVKGIGGTSKDSECSQISKIKYRRAKERKSCDVFALYIVNHQRYLPPLRRRNPPFSEQQINDAQSDERGLLTTYELFKLYNNIEQGFITKEDAKISLLGFGVVQFKPSNSYWLGHPLEIHHKGHVVILSISNITINKGDSIIVCNEQSWFKTKILDIQLNNEAIITVSEGEIGIKLSHSVLKTSELWLENNC
ncbi:hypothetical protein [Synechocystis sp. PCC 6714]|uniref:hypothetical protein n=1 Tax=Synechocystis sp. (strain PCC 6714) TaxID=1147 RepID=UPI000414117A|nr:hypothetical protein [Synechocystis sp. PCC 6714]AIE76273.1 hypothetical protein D082_51110 [Synechocystis sp. PCC 6714]